jgi:hypothetical protein
MAYLVEFRRTWFEHIACSAHALANAIQHRIVQAHFIPDVWGELHDDKARISTRLPRRALRLCSGHALTAPLASRQRRVQTPHLSQLPGLALQQAYGIVVLTFKRFCAHLQDIKDFPGTPVDGDLSHESLHA